MGNNVLDAIYNRRSIRQFTPDPVVREDLKKILEAGRFAPSGKNNQPCRFQVFLPEDKRIQTLAGYTKYGKILINAKALIAVYLDKSCMYAPMKDYQSAGAAIQNMLLAAHSLGLGGVWIGEITNRSQEVLAALNLSGEKYEFMALLALGHPGHSAAASRHPLATFMMEEW